MSEREDVEALLGEHVIDREGLVWRLVHDGGMATRAHYAGIVSIGINTLEREHGPLVTLAAHVEAVRVSERVRLAGEVEALAKERDDAQHHLAYHLADFRPGANAEATGDLAVDMAHFAERMRRERDEARAALVPVPGVRLTEEE